MLKDLSIRIDRIPRIKVRILVRYANRVGPGEGILLKDRAQIRYSNAFIPFIVLWK